MQNKGAVKLLSIALALVCLYQLSFTWFTSNVEKKAVEYSKGDLNKEYHYLDSVSGEVVYNFVGLRKYTYRECKERQINLGLDLKGGMNVVLEISVKDVVNALSNYSTDSTFRRAMALAEKNHITSPREDFITLFGNAFEQVDPNAKLAAIFSTVDLKDRVNFNSSNKEVLDVLRKEANDAIDNSFNILRSRIDKFGVIQPSIQQLETKGRILVELPGVREPERVRKLLQGTASLEFWETYDNSQLINAFIEANKRLAEIKASGKATQDTVTATKDTAKVAADKEIKKDSSALSLLEKIQKDTTAKGDTTGLAAKTNAAKEAPLFAVLGLNLTRDNQPGPGSLVGYARSADTAKVNSFLAMKQIRSLFPRDLRLLWSVKPITGSQNVFELYAIKANTRDGRAPLDGSVVIDARGQYGQNNSEAEVSMSMNGEGAKIWARMTKANVGHAIAIVLDNSVYSAPNVNGEIPNGSSQITGGFTINEANDLAIVLKSGKMPASARIVQEDIVGPSLGKESIHAGLFSFIIAFIGILLYMGLYYSRAGVVANIALFSNVFFLFGVFASMGLVLTLPGIAGIVLTLAMAVDGNVIIYERMREEVRAGKGERVVVKDGFHHAYSSIIDGHVTTILTGIVLFLFGSGPVQGFATSLIAGLLLSLFTSIFIARLAFEWMLDRNMKITLGNKYTLNLFSNLKIDFIKLRKYSYIFSGTIILIGIVAVLTRGLDPSIDFKGGRTYIVGFDKAVSTTDVRVALEKTFQTAPEVKTIGSDNRVKITTKFMIDEKTAAADSIVNHKLFEGVKGFYTTPVSYEEFTKHASNSKLGQLSSQRVDPVISNELIYKAFMAVFFGLIIIFIYIAIRFRNWKYGLGGIVSLAHDVFFIITAFALFHGVLPFSLEINQDFIAALLTIIGYSIMDTVIIYDRIREYSHLYPNRALNININDAINHTMGRSINTSGTTFVVLVVIFIFGGEILRGFVFALLVGVTIGTYSSVFIATPISYDIIQYLKKRKEKKKLQ
jgi:SecD/SecF fusion protein